jgi:phage shock protein C
MEKKLYRIREGKKIAGVCGGIAEYFAIDPTIIRLIWALVSLFAGAGILVYIVCAFVIPEKNTTYIDVD